MCNCRFVEAVITAVLCGVDSFAARNLAKVSVTFWLRCEFNKVRFEFNVSKLYRVVIRKLSLQILWDKCHWAARWAKDTIACNSAISGCSRSRQWQAGTFISQVPRIHGWPMSQLPTGSCRDAHGHATETFEERRWCLNDVAEISGKLVALLSQNWLQ